jgi:nuclease-like protein/AAA domain-containing protein
MSAAPGIWPREEPRPAKSKGERAVWSALRTGLPPGWHAWHSLRIRDKYGYLGEGDFVLAHPTRGLLALEVKGGLIEQRDGRWFSNGTPLDEAPRDQAERFLEKLRRRLAEANCAPPAWGAAICFPDTAFDRQPTEDDLASVVLGASHLPYLKEALPQVIERALPAAREPRGAWVEQLHRLWGETWVPSLSLGMRTRDIAEHRFELDAVQLGILDGLLENERVLVQGGAGSGKTLLAAEAARRHAALGKQVLVLCFTQPLRKWLAARLDPAGVEVHTVSGFAKAIADDADGPSAPDDMTDSEYWKEVLLRAGEVCEQRWDTIIVDEAQDLQEEAWLLVQELADARRLWAFYDAGQSFWADRRPPAQLFGTTFKLPRGQRCPAGVETLATRFAGAAADEKVITEAKAAGTLAFVSAPSATSVVDKAGEEIDRLLSSGLAPGDIGIVSLRGRTGRDAIFTRERIGRHAFVGADHPEMEERLVADSFLRWKGLERPAIVVTDLPDGDLSQLGIRVYVALTRALVCARLVGTREQQARYGF